MGAEPDFPADLFAVGLVALYLLTGSKPDSRGAGRALHRPRHAARARGRSRAAVAGPGQPAAAGPGARFRTATGARKAMPGPRSCCRTRRPSEEIVEVFDHIGPLPAGFGPSGPLRAAPGGAGAAGNSGSSGGGDPGSTGSTAAAGHASASETGSFPLAPPALGFPAPQQPSTPPTPTPTPLPGGMPPAQGTPPPAPAYEPTAGVPRDHSAGTRPYTAAPYPVPADPRAGVPGAGGPVTPAVHPAASLAAPVGTAAGSGLATAPLKRPGPPPKVAVPVLIVALLCIAVGVWALTAA